MIQKVLVCEGFGCRATSQPHAGEVWLHYERLCNSWGRIDRKLGTEDVPEYEDWCPRCCAMIFFEWVYVVIQGKDYFGCALMVRPDTNEFLEWDQNYDPKKWECVAGRNLKLEGGHSSGPREDGAHILPAFIFDQE